MVNSVFNRIDYFPRLSGWIFILCLLIMSFLYDYQEIIKLRPQGLHQWRQCDCLSLTLNYAKDRYDFLDPQMHSQEADKGASGRTIRELPYFYFIIATLWKIFGVHEWMYRALVILFVFTGLFFLFKTIEDVLKNSFWGIGISLLLFTSPFFVYYTNNFIDDTPSLALSMVSLFFFWKYYDKRKIKYFLICLLFCLLAVLTRVISVLLLLGIITLFAADLLKLLRNKEGARIFNKPVLSILLFVSVFLIIFLWYSFARKFNLIHHSGFFLIGTLPLWQLDWQNVRIIMERVGDFWISQYFAKSVLILCLILLLSFLFHIRKIERIWLILTSSVFAGVIAYLVLYFKVLENHDYHLICLLILIPLIFITFLDLLQKQYPVLYHSFLLKVAFLILFISSFFHAQTNLKQRYSGWMNKTHMAYYKPLETITPYLRSLGIERSDKVLSIPDPSFNITLYLMDQKGYTSGGSNTDSFQFFKMFRNGLQYIIINDDRMLEHPAIKGYLKYPVGIYQSIKIYDVRPYKKMFAP